MSNLKEILDTFTTHVSLSYASYKAGIPEEGQHEWDVPPEEVVVGLQFSEKGFGFGEVAIKQTARGVFVYTEHMNLARVKKYLNILLRSAITDTDQDPEKHALYNQVMGRRCGEQCLVCCPDGGASENGAG